MIQLTGLIKPFGSSRAIDGLTLTVARGESVALWGHNGAGKSTTLKCILGLLDYQGEIQVAGRCARRESRAVRQMIGYVPQELAYWEMTVGATLEFFADLKRVPYPQAVLRLVEVGLAGELRKLVGELSGGMRQRLALALALLSDPPVLLLDEPTASLDERSRSELMELLLGCKQAGKTILFASHRPEDLLRLADRIILMEGGKQIGAQTPAEFTRSMTGPEGVRRLNTALEGGGRTWTSAR